MNGLNDCSIFSNKKKPKKSKFNSIECNFRTREKKMWKIIKKTLWKIINSIVNQLTGSRRRADALQGSRGFLGCQKVDQRSFFGKTPKNEKKSPPKWKKWTFSVSDVKMIPTNQLLIDNRLPRDKQCLVQKWKGGVDDGRWFRGPSCHFRWPWLCRLRCGLKKGQHRVRLLSPPHTRMVGEGGIGRSGEG